MTTEKTTAKTAAKPADVRGDESKVRDESEMRADRETDEREITEDPELSDEVRLEMLRGGGQAILPDLPQKEGYHRVWLSSTNGSDPIHRRVQLGYKPIMASAIPGFEHASLKSGQFQGCVSVNEMIAFEIEERLYQKYMKELHFHAPNREEQSVNAIYDQAIAEAAKINDRAQTLLTEEGRVRQNLSIPEPDFA